MAVRGGWLFLAFLMTLVVYDLGRFHLQHAAGSARSVSAAVWIQLEDEQGELNAIHQIYDAADIDSVIKLAKLEIAPDLIGELASELPLESGKSFKFQVDRGRVVAVEVGWMPAARRMALAVPLHVDRMSFKDWCDLPGVGPSLARRILLFRQKNGGFDDFEDLARISGVGKKRLEAWRPFF